MALHTIINFFLRRAWTGQFARKDCTHLGMAKTVEPASDVCLRCVEAGDSWPALRMCLTCGHVGCCDKAKNQVNWIWCYEDKALLDPL